MDQQTRIVFERAVALMADELEARVDALAKACEGLEKTQMSNLERVGLTSRRFGDVVAFVKRQTGKDKGWAQRADAKPLGQIMVEFLEELRSRADKACDEDQRLDRNELRMRLAGVCLRNMHSAYLYRREVKN